MRRNAGFTYLTILFVVAIMGVGLALAGEVWHTAAVREREAELLHVGEQYRKAIERYYLNGPRIYPRALPDLLRDARKPGVERYLRRLHPDPVTGEEWSIVKAPDGGVMGVHSKSEAKPIKVAGFSLANKSFENAQKYSDWQFVYTPPATAAPKPGAATPAPGAPTPASAGKPAATPPPPASR